MFEIQTKYILYPKNIHNSKSIHPCLISLNLPLISKSKELEAQPILKQVIDILDVLTNALSDAQEYPFT